MTTFCFLPETKSSTQCQKDAHCKKKIRNCHHCNCEGLGGSLTLKSTTGTNFNLTFLSYGAFFYRLSCALWNQLEPIKLFLFCLVLLFSDKIARSQACRTLGTARVSAVVVACDHPWLFIFLSCVWLTNQLIETFVFQKFYISADYFSKKSINMSKLWRKKGCSKSFSWPLYVIFTLWSRLELE